MRKSLPSVEAGLFETPRLLSMMNTVERLNNMRLSLDQQIKRQIVVPSLLALAGPGVVATMTNNPMGWLGWRA